MLQEQNETQLQLFLRRQKNWARCLQSSAIRSYACENQFERGETTVSLRSGSKI